MMVGMLVTLEIAAVVEEGAALGDRNEAAIFGFDDRKPGVRSPAGQPLF